jgi:phenylacetate-coenzyme A ligase PaaK-like adenylate-forming protein
MEDFEEKGGSYIWEDHFYPEILDPVTKEPVPFGEEGVLVITTLTKKQCRFCVIGQMILQVFIMMKTPKERW